MKLLKIDERYEIYKNLNYDEKEEYDFKFDDIKFNTTFESFLFSGFISLILSIATKNYNVYVSNGLFLAGIYFIGYWTIVAWIYIYKRNKWFVEKKKVYTEIKE